VTGGGKGSGKGRSHGTADAAETHLAKDRGKGVPREGTSGEVRRAKKRWRVKERTYRGVPLRRVFAFWRQCCATSQFVWRVTRQTDCQHLSDADSE
jgi:hypothetical protein